MYSSYQPFSHTNYNFLHSKPTSLCIQQSEYIIEDHENEHEHFSQTNKQNHSIQLNKTNRSHHSQISIPKHGMITSKSHSAIMAQSKQRQLVESNRSGISQKSMLKSHKPNPALKVLTQSDLTQNHNVDSSNDHIFSDSQPQPQNKWTKTQQFQSRNVPNTLIPQFVESQEFLYQKMMTNSKSNHHLIGVKNTMTLSQNHSNNHNNDFNMHRQFKTQRTNKKLNKKQMIYQQPDSNYCNSVEEEEQSIKIPDFTFIANQKLQVRHYSPQNKPTISFSQLISLLPHNISALKKVKKLSIINCSLNSLQGIQHFESLEDLNLRKNQLRQVQQLYRITNKQAIHSINILGNDIQHFQLARYTPLTKLFTNLQELNDKNYALMKKKQRGDMKKIIHKSTKLQYQLRKTLKKQIKHTDRAIFRLNPLLIGSNDQEETQRTHNSHQKVYNHQISDRKATQKDQYSYQNEVGYSNRHYNSSVSRKSASQIKSPTNALNIHNKFTSGNISKKRKQLDEPEEVYEVQQSGINPNSYSLGESSKEKSFVNKPNLGPSNRPQLREVSLSNLENIPITKSVKCQQKSPSKIGSNNHKKSQEDKQNMSNNSNQKSNRSEIPLQTVPLNKNMLEINTSGLENQQDLGVHLHQPTATFAMQKEREQQCNLQNKQFMFKNKKTTNNQFSISSMNNGPNKTVSKPTKKDHEQIFQEHQFDEDENQMSLRISRISQIPTKRLSNNRRSMTSHSLKPQQRSRLYQNYDNNTSQMNSFMTGNDFFPQNNTYMGMSQLSQWRPNQSMDEDCLLKDKKDLLQQEKIVIATAVYMQNLLRKTLIAFTLQGNKRKNMPKKRVFF